MSTLAGGTGRLAGRAVVVTRTGDSDDRLGILLEAYGAEVRRWPTLSFLPPEDPAALLRALEDAPAFDWIAFTSPRAVDAVTAALGNRPRSAWRVAAVGESTARALRCRGWPVDLVGEGAGARDLATAVADRTGSRHDRRVRVLFPAGSRARDTLVGALERAGMEVTRVEAYRTVVSPPAAAELERDLIDPADALTFASPSAVEGVDRGMGGRLAERLGGRPAVVIGPTTAGALRRRGARRIVQAEEPTLEALARAVVRSL